VSGKILCTMEELIATLATLIYTAGLYKEGRNGNELVPLITAAIDPLPPSQSLPDHIV
jgi:hypothetical protein